MTTSLQSEHLPSQVESSRQGMLRGVTVAEQRRPNDRRAIFVSCLGPIRFIYAKRASLFTVANMNTAFVTSAASHYNVKHAVAALRYLCAQLDYSRYLANALYHTPSEASSSPVTCVQRYRTCCRRRLCLRAGCE